MKVTVVAQNLGNGGLSTGDGLVQDRWPVLAERITGAGDRIDVVLLCEASGWDRHGHAQLARAMADLDLDAVPLPPSRSGMPTALLYRREILGRWSHWYTDLAAETWHGFGVASFAVPGLAAPLSFTAAHLSPYSAERALIEANIIATAGYRYGPYAVLAGDINYPPADAGNPLPDFTQMRPYNLGSRTLLLPDSDPGADPVPDRRVTRKLAQNGYHDVAWTLHQSTGDKQLLARTASDDRIDQAWISGPLVPAVSGYRILDTPTGASDHHGLVFTIDTDLIDQTTPWRYR